MQTSSGLGRKVSFDIELCLFHEARVWKIFEYGSADTMALLRTIISFRGGLYLNQTRNAPMILSLSQKFPGGKHLWYSACPHVQKVQAAWQKSHCSRKHFDPNFKEFLCYLDYF